MKQINSQQDFDQMLFGVDWEDAFIRECHLLSPSYVDGANRENKGIVAYNAESSMRMLICTPEKKFPGIEFFFQNIKNVSLPFVHDLSPRAEFSRDRIIFYLISDRTPAILCEFLFCQILGTECWGWDTRYGIENIFTEGGDLNFDIIKGWGQKWGKA